ncbi:unnamed protein product [Blepharisma stoltei]|uniref:EF-hand domain-containing protein n=1 Tax=Blepharisma stoltei TaxID=1481888 RepID=A0AAU9KBP7_9CILI|nr:unnamed protein product [Blepharisma stoltei]
MDNTSIREEVLAELNLCRANPKSYATIVAGILDLFKGNEIHKPGEIPLETQEGPAAVQECIKRLRSIKPIAPLSLSEGMSKAAQDHCNDLGPQGIIGHDGTDGSTAESRIERYGEWDVTSGENCDFGNDRARDIVVSLLVDDGVPGRGHRENILNPDFKVVGIGFGPHAQYKYMCTIDFAGGFTESANSGAKPKNEPKGKAGNQPKGQGKNQQGLGPYLMPAVCSQVIDEINAARTNPKAYADNVAAVLKLLRGNEIHKPGETPIETQEGAVPIQECIKRLKAMKPIGPLELSVGMSKAAQDHCDDLGPQGITGHNGTDGSTMESRIERYGEWDVTVGENCDFGNDQARDIVVSLLIDDGVTGRGHRENILNPDFKVAGVGFGSHAQFNHMCTIDFAGGFTESADQPERKAPGASQPSGKNQPGGSQAKPQAKGKPGEVTYPPIYQEVIDELNLCRTNPKNYANVVAEILKFYKGKEIHKPGEIPIETQEGTAPVQEVIKRLKAMKPIGPLTLSLGVSWAAQDHCDDLGPKGETGHDGTDGSTMEGRIERYGEWDVTVGENCDFGNNNARDIVVSLLIDDGVQGRGHRENILNPAYKVAGVGFGYHKEFNHMCTIDFAGGFEEKGNLQPRDPVSSPEESKNQGGKPAQAKGDTQPSEYLELIQEVINEINVVRTNPKAYVDVVNNFLKFYKGNEIRKPGETPIITQEGPAAVQDCLKRLRAMKPIPPIELSYGLSLAAQDHCEDIGPQGATGHDGTNGSTTESRIENHGDWDVTIGENIDFGNNNATDIVVSWLIDDGVPGRGHRENILNPAYKVAGVGFGSHTEFGYVCTIDFAGGFREDPNQAPPKGSAGKGKASEETKQSPGKPTKGQADSPAKGGQTAPGKGGQTAPGKGESQPDNPALLQEVVDEINACRTNPKAYADAVADILKFYKGKMLTRPGETPIETQEGPAPVQEVIKRLKAMNPIGPIELSDDMSKAAKDHCDDLGPKGETGHDGTDGSTAESRLERYGDWDVTIGENIDFGNNNARDIVVSLLIDDGVPGRGHRENILNPAYKVAGVGFGNHTEYGQMCTIDFAGGFVGKQSPAKGGQAAKGKEPLAAKGKEPPAPKGKEAPAPKGKEASAPKGKEAPAPKGKEPAKGKDAKGKDPRSGTAKGKSPNSSIPEGVTLTPDEIEEVKQAFDLFDLDGSGTIDPREISAALASMEDERDTTMFRLLGGIEELGAAITFEDFLLHINDRLGNRNSKEGVQKIFDLFDSDGSGRISVKNFAKVLRELGDTMTDEEIKETIAKVSSDGVSMTVDDFYNVMTKRNYA